MSKKDDKVHLKDRMTGAIHWCAWTSRRNN